MFLKEKPFFYFCNNKNVGQKSISNFVKCIWTYSEPRKLRSSGGFALQNIRPIIVAFEVVQFWFEEEQP